jgi:hypothetical protein
MGVGREIAAAARKARKEKVGQADSTTLRNNVSAYQNKPEESPGESIFAFFSVEAVPQRIQNSAPAVARLASGILAGRERAESALLGQTLS